MGATKLIGRIACPAYSCLGTWCSEPPVVKHIGILPHTTLLIGGKRIGIYDMGPPLRAGQADEKGKALLSLVVPAVVGVLPLSDEERDAVQVNIEDIRRRIPHPMTRSATIGNDICREALAQYVAVPAYEERKGDSSGGPQYLRCSCAGFVLYAYRDVVDLLDVTNIPLVSLSEIVRIWPIAADPAVRSNAGLVGDGPWRVVLPGYVFNAIDAGRSAMPYSAVTEDRAFPQRHV